MHNASKRSFLFNQTLDRRQKEYYNKHKERYNKTADRQIISSVSQVTV